MFGTARLIVTADILIGSGCQLGVGPGRGNRLNCCSQAAARIM
jgi:hypothetical protein